MYGMFNSLVKLFTGYDDNIDRTTETNSGNVANRQQPEEERMAAGKQTRMRGERAPTMGMNRDASVDDGRWGGTAGRKHQLDPNQDPQKLIAKRGSGGDDNRASHKEKRRAERGHEVDQKQGLANETKRRPDNIHPRDRADEEEARERSGGPASLEPQLRELQRRLTQSQSQGEAQRKQYDEQIKRTARDLEEQQLRVREYQDKLAQSQRQYRATMEEMHLHQEQEAKVRQAELHQIQVEHAQVKALLKVRTDELLGAQSFLNKADLLSGAEVIAMVDALNSEILQAAASISDSFEFRKVNTNAGSEQKAACERVRTDFGPKMALLLATVRHVEDPMLIQIALQSRLVRDCKMIIESWCFDKTRDHLVEVYEAVRKTEDQAVSGRWRALTRSHVRLLRDGGPAATLQLSKDIIANNLADVLIAGGYHESSKKVLEVIRARFSDGITTVANLALRLNRTIGEEVTSSDLGVVYVPEGVAFVPENMEDIGGESGARPSKADRVLCTTDLGLQQGAREANGNRSSMLLLKPKVVMESLTKDMSRG